MERSCDTVGTVTAHDARVQSFLQRAATHNKRTYVGQLHLPRLTCVNLHQLCCGRSGSCLQQLRNRPAHSEQDSIHANRGVTAAARAAGTKPTHTSSQWQLFLLVRLCARLLPSMRVWRPFCHGQKTNASRTRRTSCGTAHVPTGREENNPSAS